MSRRWSFAAAAICVAAALLTVLAVAGYVHARLPVMDANFESMTRDEVQASIRDANLSFIWLQLAPWLAGASLVAGAACLAMLARARPRRGTAPVA